MRAQLLRIISAQVFLHASMSGTRMAAPLLALQQGHSPIAIGVLLALFALTQVFLALPAGRWADRVGLHRPLHTSVAVATTGVGLAVIWPNFGMLCLAALATGAATGMAVIALQRHVGRMAHGSVQLRQAFSWLAIGPAFSNVLGPVLAGLLIDHAGPTPSDIWGFRAALLAMALMPLLTLWMARRVQALPERETPGAAGSGLRALDLLRRPAIRRLLAVNWLLSTCWDVHTFVVPVLGHERGLSASAVGFVLGGFAVSAVLVRIALPMLPARIREYQIITAAMAASGLLFAVYPFMPGAWGMGACSLLLGLALGSVQPMVMSMLHQITPPHRQGEALGLRLMTINAASVLMPMLFGSAGALVGVSLVFWLVGGAVLGGAPQAWKLGRARPHAHQAVEKDQAG